VTEKAQIITVVETTTLVMDKDEAETLWAILRKVAGDEELSPRKHAKSMRLALERANVGKTGPALRSVYLTEWERKVQQEQANNAPGALLTGQIRFDNYPAGARG
jgi:hypothetical protein